MITVADIYSVSSASAVEEILRVTSGRHYLVEGVGSYLPHISGDFSFNETLFSQGTTEGAVSVGYGTLVLDNTDGRFDAYKFSGFDGQAIKIWRVKDEQDPQTDSNLYFVGTLLYAEFDWTTVTFYVRSRLEELNIAIQPSVFAGTNNGITGLEGESDIGGKTKPMVWGTCLNVPLYRIQQYLQVYACNYDKDGNRKAIARVNGVYDKGGKIKWDQSDYPDVASLIAATVQKGFYATCLAEGLIKFGTTPLANPTAFVDESIGASAAAPSVVRRILEEVKGWVAGQDFDTGSLDALQLLNPVPVQFYVTGKETILDVCNQLLSSIGGWMAPDSRGLVSFGRIDLPSNMVGPSLVTITADLLVKGTIRRKMTGDQSKSIPAKKVELKYSRIWEVVREALPSVEEWWRQFLSDEYRSMAFEADPSLVTVHKLAPTIEYDTLLVGPPEVKVDNPSFTQATRTGSKPRLWDYVEDGAATVTAGGEFNPKCILPADGLHYSRVWQYMGPAYPNAVEMAIDNYVLEFNVIHNDGVLFAAVFDVLDPYPGGAAIASIEYNEMGNTAGLRTLEFSCPSVSGVQIVFGLAGFAIGSAEFSQVRVYKLGPEPNIRTEVDRRGGIVSSNVERYTFDVPAKYVPSSRPGSLLTLMFPRFGMNDGVRALVIGRDEDLNNEMVNLDVFIG